MPTKKPDPITYRIMQNINGITQTTYVFSPTTYEFTHATYRFSPNPSKLKLTSQVSSPTPCSFSPYINRFNPTIPEFTAHAYGFTPPPTYSHQQIQPFHLPIQPHNLDYPYNMQVQP